MFALRLKYEPVIAIWQIFALNANTHNFLEIILGHKELWLNLFCQHTNKKKHAAFYKRVSSQEKLIKLS